MCLERLFFLSNSDIEFRSALDWAALKADSIVVDIGGGAGNVTLFLAKAFPHLKYVVQDLKPVITDAAEKVSPVYALLYSAVTV